MALYGVLACGQDDAVEEHRGERWFERVELTGTATDAVTATHAKTALAISAWEAETDGASELSNGVFAVRGRGLKTVRVPGPFDPGSFNEVELELTTPARAPVVVGFRRAGREVFRSDKHWIPTSPDPVAVVVHCARNQLETAAYDELFIEIDKATDGFDVHALALRSSSIASFLPAWNAAPQLTYIGDEARQAIGLVSNRALAATVAVHAGSRLSFAHGLGPGLLLEGHEPELVVTIASSGQEPLERRFASVAGQWRTESIELGRFAGASAEVRFELAPDGELELALLLAEVVVEHGTPAPPTVLFITSDTHRADHLGCMDGVEVATPNIDALAERGLVFESAWSSSNVTIPSHAALLTGRHPRDTRIFDNRSGLSEAAVTLAEQFHAGGFVTWAVVSARHLSHAISGVGQGFDRMSTTSTLERTADESISVLEDWLDEAGSKPLFIWLHLFDAHQEYVPPEEFAAPYIAAIERRRPDGELFFKDIERARYRGEVTYLDHRLGQLLARERLQSALVGFTADHGESLGEHDIDFHHSELYPQSIHVPLILAGPGIPRARRAAGRTRQLNLGRTLLDMAGLVRADFPGENLLTAMQRATAPPIFAVSSRATSASVVDGPWLLIKHLVEHRPPGRKADRRVYARHEIELFHLGNDPTCRNNVLESRKAEARRLHTLLAEWLASADVVPWGVRTELTDEVQAQLVQMGYAGGEAADESIFLIQGCDCDHCARLR